MAEKDISAVIMTFNEEANLEDCLNSISGFVKAIYIVDSYSGDATLEIGRKYGAHIYQNKFLNQAAQFKWAIDTLPIDTTWLMRVDADERWTSSALKDLAAIMDSDAADSVYVKMRIYFMDRWMKHGGFYPNHYLRVFKTNHVHIENSMMDEHVFPYGRTKTLESDIVEYNKNDRNYSITNFISKHNAYSTREAAEYLRREIAAESVHSVGSLSGGRTERKRYLRDNLYYRLPLFLRPALYFVYRYFFQLGFLDGREGFIFHFLQGLWYRFLVDVKIYEAKTKARNSGVGVAAVVRELHGIDLERVNGN